jgi:hypothetical protein
MSTIYKIIVGQAKAQRCPTFSQFAAVHVCPLFLALSGSSFCYIFLLGATMLFICKSIFPGLS